MMMYTVMYMTKALTEALVILYSLRSVCWLVGSGSGEPVEGGVVQKKSGNTGNILAAQSGWGLQQVDHMIVT